MRRVLALFVPLVLLWGLVAEVNHALTAVRVYLFAGALFVTFAGLLQPRGSGIIAVLLAGLTCDAAAPVVLGTHVVLFFLAHAVVYRVRERLPRSDTITQIVVVLLLNLALFFAFSFTQIHRSPAPAAIWPRLLVDLLCSQVFLLLITPWFFALQARTLELARVPPEEHA